MASAYAAVAFIAFFLVIVPTPWHWRARNIATLSTIFWLATGDLTAAIRAILWENNVIIKAEVFCDISLALYNASAFALPAAAVCITRHLESVSSPRYSSSGLNDKRNRRIFEILMCFVFPCLFSLLHMVVQGHRFDIIEEIGCQQTTYMSWAAVWLFYFPPIALSLVTSIYAALALRWFIQRRAQFRDVLSTNSGLTTARYLRLMGLAIVEMCGAFGFCLWIIVAESQIAGIQPWVSWDWVHSDFSRIDQVPRVYVDDGTWGKFVGSWSIVPVSSFLFFAFFAFGEEAMAEYKRYWNFILVHVFRTTPTPTMSTLPSYMTRSVPISSKNHEMSAVSHTHSGHSRQDDFIESKWDDDNTDLDSIVDSRMDTKADDRHAFAPSSTFAPPHHQHNLSGVAPPPNRDLDHIIISLSRRPSLAATSELDLSTPPPSIRIDGTHQPI